jgi:DNA polymerase III subunit alpha
LKGRDLTFGGMVTNVNHRVSKNGKPFGTFTIEDYTGNTDLTMFGEDYLKFRHLMVIGNFLFVKARVQERWMQQDNLEVKVLAMQLLSDVREKMVKNITIDIALEEISGNFMNNFLEVIKLNPGNCNVRFNVIERKENLKVEMNSRKYKVAPHNEFLKELEVRQLTYRLK